MSNIAKIYSAGLSHQFNPAIVLDDEVKNGCITVNFQQVGMSSPVLARLAISLDVALAVGDEVLIAGQNVELFYVIGVLSQLNSSSKQRHDLGDGTYALIDNGKDTPGLQVYSENEELLIEFDPASQKTKINIEKGNLEFTTQDGDIILDSSHNIKLKGNQIDLASTSSIQLSVGDALGQLISTLNMKANQLKLNSTQLSMTANKSDIHIKKAHYIGDDFKANIKTTKLIVDKIRTVANSITQKTKIMYNQVEELSQIKAGRMRTLISGSFHLKAKKSYLKAEDDFKVNAKKIHLG